MTSYAQQLCEYEAARAAASARPEDATSAFNHGWRAAKIGRFTEAIAAYEQAIALGLSGAEEAMTNIASVYSERLGQAELAGRWLDRALSTNPEYYPAVFNRAHLSEQLGDRDSAIANFERALFLQPDDPLPLARLAEALTDVNDDHPVITRLRSVARMGDPDVLMSLAKVDERLGNYAGAWQAMVQANAADRARYGGTWSAAIARERQLGQLGYVSQSTGSRSQLPPQSAPEQAKDPVFIVGMFRTGSTLLEQILAAHPSFTPLGESEYWPRQIAALGGGMVLPGRLPDRQVASQLAQGFYQHLTERGVDVACRVTDKRPDNLFHLPTLMAALPRARFIITIRDWRDTLLSVFGTRLHPQHGYAIDVEKIRDQLALCSEIAEKACQIWPERVRVISYEALVDDPTATLKPLFEWLGETWTEDCLNFHQLDNPVRTASVWQVREPLSRSRQGRWRLYEQSLRAIFGDDLDNPAL